MKMKNKNILEKRNGIYNADDRFIFINARLNHETQCKAYDHEIAHINNRDFEKMIPADRLEAYAHMLSA